MSRVNAQTVQIQREKLDRGERVVFSGRIDERADLDELAADLAGPVTFDLERVDFINSVGVRQWIKLLRALADRDLVVRLERCSEPMVQQLNMIVDARGNAEVVSLFAPYACDDCGFETSMCLQVAEHASMLATLQAPEQRCPECSGAMELVEMPERYFMLFEEL